MGTIDLNPNGSVKRKPGQSDASLSRDQKKASAFLGTLADPRDPSKTKDQMRNKRGGKGKER